MSTIDVYISSVSSNLELKKQQQRIEMVLQGKKIPFELKDISAEEALKNKMRELSRNPTALPPQLCIGDEYLGDYNAFESAVEMEELESFLRQ